MRIWEKENARERLSLPMDRKVVLVLGGSLGALSLVKEVLGLVERFEDVFFLIQTGKRNYGLFDRKEGANFKLVSFLPEMDCVYSAIDIAVSRAGGTTISEMAYFGIPAILVPYPYAAMDHQRANAEALLRKGACIVVDESDFGTGKLEEALRGLLMDENLQGRLRRSIRTFSNPNAAVEIIKTMES